MPTRAHEDDVVCVEGKVYLAVHVMQHPHGTIRASNVVYRERKQMILSQVLQAWKLYPGLHAAPFEKTSPENSSIENPEP